MASCKECPVSYVLIIASPEEAALRAAELYQEGLEIAGIVHSSDEAEYFLDRNFDGYEPKCCRVSTIEVSEKIFGNGFDIRLGKGRLVNIFGS